MNTMTSKPISLTSREPLNGRRDLADRAETERSPVTTVWTILRLTFGLVPVVAGLDKFTNLLTNWESYLNPAVLTLLPLSGHTFMAIVGVVEIAAGILVLARPRLGALVVTAWLTCIALSLLASGRYLDVAVRDLVMAIGAYTLATLTPLVQRGNAAAPSR